MKTTLNERHALASIANGDPFDFHGNTWKSLISKRLAEHNGDGTGLRLTAEGRKLVDSMPPVEKSTGETESPKTTQRQIDKLLEEVKDELDRLGAIVGDKARAAAADDLVEYLQLHYGAKP